MSTRLISTIKKLLDDEDVLKRHDYGLIVYRHPYCKMGNYNDKKTAKEYIEKRRSNYLHNTVLSNILSNLSNEEIHIMVDTANSDYIFSKLESYGITLSDEETINIKSKIENFCIRAKENAISSFSATEISKDSVKATAIKCIRQVTSGKTISPEDKKIIDEHYEQLKSSGNLDDGIKMFLDTNSYASKTFRAIQVESICANKKCKNKVEALCVKCMMIGYCGKKCQEKHWSCHKKDCKKSAAKKAQYAEAKVEVETESASKK